MNFTGRNYAGSRRKGKQKAPAGEPAGAKDSKLN
jgi:hypothetical protein